MKRRVISRRSSRSFRWSWRILLVVLLLLLVGIISVYGWFRSATHWDGQRRFTFIWQRGNADAGHTQPLGIFSLEPHSGRAIYLRLPANTLVDVPFGYKTYPLASVYQLGELDETHGGGELLTKSIEGTAGIILDGYVIIENEHYPSPITTLDELLEIKQSYATWRGLIRQIWQSGGGIHGIRTDIPLQTWYQVWEALRLLRADQIHFIDLEKTAALVDTRFPDGSLAQAFDRDAFDTILGDRLQDGQIRAEALTVEVVNASGADGVAGQVGVMLERLGGHVIVKSTAKEIVTPGCQFFIAADVKPNDSVLLRYLTEVWGCEAGADLKRTPRQSDVLIVIGEEFTQ